MPLRDLLAGALEDQPDLPFGLADVLVEQLRALDVEEVALGVRSPLLLRDALGQAVGDRLGDHGLAAAWGAVQQDALGRAQLVLDEQVGVQERQLHGVLDRLDLRSEAADVGVGDVRHLLQHQLLDLGPLQLLQGVPGPGFDHQVVTGPQGDVGELLGHSHDLLVIGVADHQDPAVPHHVLDGHDLADDLERGYLHDVERLVEQDLLADAQGLAVDLGADVDAQLAPLGEDLHRIGRGAGAHVDAVAAGWGGELLHLLLQRHHLLAGVPQGVGQLAVLRQRRVQLRLGLQETLLHGPDTGGRVVEPAPQQRRLLLQELDPGPQCLDLLV